jgi:uncharacterized protein (UPF0276 family)
MDGCSLPCAARAAVPVPARAGIGLRFPHHDAVLAVRPATAWFEVHPENYLGHGPAAAVLERVRRDYPVSLHATGLSLGSAAGVDGDHLAAIAGLAARIEPGLVSDHLSWSAAGGVNLPDLFPLPLTNEALDIFCNNLDRVQTVLRRPILVENPSVYVALPGDMEEGDFLAELVRRTGCGVLLDINNIAVSAFNLGRNADARLQALLDALPHGAVGEIHLAGHAERALPDGGVIRIDDHGAPVSGEVWRLFRAAIRHLGAVPSLIERDNDIPAFSDLAAEAAIADRFLLSQGVPDAIAV